LTVTVKNVRCAEVVIWNALVMDNNNHCLIALSAMPYADPLQDSSSVCAVCAPSNLKLLIMLYYALSGMSYT